MKLYNEMEQFFRGFSKGEEVIHNPAHYQSDEGLEAIDVIEAFGLNFNRGNVAKYLLRAGKKGSEIDDLKKALWYLRREINVLEESNEA